MGERRQTVPDSSPARGTMLSPILSRTLPPFFSEYSVTHCDMVKVIILTFFVVPIIMPAIWTSESGWVRRGGGMTGYENGQMQKPSSGRRFLLLHKTSAPSLP